MEESDTVTFNLKSKKNHEMDEHESVRSDSESESEVECDPSENMPQQEDTGDGVNLMDRIERCMNDMRSEFRNGVDSVREEMRDTLREFDRKIHANQQRKTDERDYSSNNINSEACENADARSSLGRGRINEREIPLGAGHGDVPSMAYHSRGRERSPSRRMDHIRFADSSTPNFLSSQGGVKVKPQTYDGTDDLDEYLTQFNLVSELNGWDYNMKSLFLASSMVGETRAILCELEPEKRKDYLAIVSALQTRYGSVNRAEIFRSKLQGKVLGKNETIPELAQTIRKLTRQAYPSAASEVLDLLAMDYFIDAIPDSDIRLRLREVGPKSISEAERIAVRLDAHKVADRARGRRVRAMDQDVTGTESKLNGLFSQLTNLVQEMKAARNTRAPEPTNVNPDQQRRWVGQYSNPRIRHDNSRFRNQTGNARAGYGGPGNFHQPRRQGNWNRSSSRTTARQ